MREAHELPIMSSCKQIIILITFERQNAKIIKIGFAARKGLKLFNSHFSQCYMYCLWEQFGLVDDKRELSLNGMLTFFQRIPAYRAEVEKAISECKGIGNYFGIYSVFSFVYSYDQLRVLESCIYAENNPLFFLIFS